MSMRIHYETAAAEGVPVKPSFRDVAAPANTQPAQGGNAFGEYLSKIAVLVPVEATAVYLAFKGVTSLMSGNEELALFLLFVTGVIITAVVKTAATVDPDTQDFDPDWVHVILSLVAFLVWTYALDNPLAYLKVPTNPFIALLLTALYTALLPAVHKLIRMAQIMHMHRTQ